MSKEKFFSVNMNTTEEPKTENNNNNKISSSANSNHVKQSTYDPNSTQKKGIVFNQADLEKKMKVPNTVRKIENPEELFDNKREKMRGKDLKLVLVPGIVLLILSILNELFAIPYLMDKTVTYVLNGNLNVKMAMGNMQNEQLVALAGLIAIVSYCVFSIALFGFSIYALFKRVYVKKDLLEIAGKIMLYAFLIGFFVAVIDSFVPINLSEIVVRISTVGLHSMKSFVK